MEMATEPSFPAGAGNYQWGGSFWAFPDTTLAWFTYDVQFSQMLVQEKSGVGTMYLNVPQQVAVSFLYSTDPDTFYTQQIKSSFAVQ